MSVSYILYQKHGTHEFFSLSGLMIDGALTQRTMQRAIMLETWKK